MAEYYSIHDLHKFKPFYLSILVSGLPSDSRSIRAITGQKYTNNEMLQMMMVDDLNLLVWFQTKDGMEGKNRPHSLFTEEKTKEEEVQSFQTSDEFEKERRRLLDKIQREEAMN